MSRQTVKPPAYRLHRGSGQALVQLDGRRIYLGRYGSDESKERYRKLVAEWLAGSTPPVETATAKPLLTVAEVAIRYLDFCRTYYRDPDGSPSSEFPLVQRALKALRHVYSREPAAEFGPLKLKAVREHLIAEGLSRPGVNANIRRIKRAFRWAVENELVPPTVHQGLAAVAGLKRGRCEAPETEPVKPVPQHWIDAVLPLVPPPVAALIRLQLLTGARPSELLLLRGCDLETTGEVWVLRPDRHKTAHYGHAREIYFGPQAQGVLKPWLKLDTQAYLFSPAEAEAERNERKKAARKTKRWPSHCKRKRKANRRRPPGQHYDVAGYRRAIHRACDVADKQAHQQSPEAPVEQRMIPRWSPHRLRHNAATNLRRQHGVELARIILGHTTAFTTEIYAEVDRAKAVRIMAEVG